MTADPTNQPNKKHLPNLGEFGVAILEHYVTSLIGAGAVGKLREPYQKNKLFLSLIQALERTENRFLKSSQNSKVRDLLLQLPLRKDQELLESLKDFSGNPGSPSLTNLLTVKIRKYAPIIDEEDVIKAVSEYVEIFREELISVPEIKDTLSTWATIETSKSVKKIEGNSFELVDLLKQVVNNTGLIATATNNVNQTVLKVKSTSTLTTSANVYNQDYYIVRQQDKDLKRELKQTGMTVTIKGPRKTGKTLLLSNFLSKVEKKYVYIDLETIDDHILGQNDSFYAVFCEIISSELNIKTKHQGEWKDAISATQQVTAFIEDHIIKELNEPLIIAIDHADKLIGTNLSVDFFSMLRHWHNNRFKGTGWGSVDLVIVISTDPKLLIKDDHESPFNVGEIIHLDDFSYSDTLKLNSLFGNPLTAENLHQLFKIVSGHPYLTRLAMEAVSNNRLEQTELITSPIGKRSPFMSYLRYLSLELTANPNLLKALKQITEHKYPNKQCVNVLLQAGIVQIVNSQLDFRNLLYRLYFKEIL